MPFYYKIIKVTITKEMQKNIPWKKVSMKFYACMNAQVNSDSSEFGVGSWYQLEMSINDVNV